MATGSALNLSLLSRGVGEVKRNGTEKVDVIFEPQDYFNFVEGSHERPFFLPPLQPRYGFTTHEPPQLSSRKDDIRYTQSYTKDAVHLPKTFTTRKGALLLFSEDMANRTRPTEHHKKHRALGFHSNQDVTDSTNPITMPEEHDLKTVDDLAKSILSYGGFDEGKMNLKFLQKQRRYDFDRQIRPGFSAKRYLSTWTKTWDDNVLEKVISKGYLTEKSLFYYNPLLPHLSRRLNDDLSHYPTPYKLLRSMLISPGSLSGYTFYRVRPESQETDYYDIAEEEDEESRLSRSRGAGSVKVASLAADGHLHEAVYSQLDKKSQAEVLTDLLVKGAVHYALEKQQVYATKIVELPEEETKNIPKFDMRDAVESMLQSSEQRGVPAQVLDADLPERDDRSQQSGSFKGSKLGQHRRGPTGELSVTWRDDASSHSSASGRGLPTTLPGPAPLPPIGHQDKSHTQLTPIGEASREHTQAYIAQTNTEEEEEGWAGGRVVERPADGRAPAERDALQREAEERRRQNAEKRRNRVSAHSVDLEGQVLGAQGFMSSSDSLGPGSQHSTSWHQGGHKQQQWKGSQQSLRSHGSRKTSGSQVDGGADSSSARGSVVYGPDGQVIKVGETMKLSARAPDIVNIHDANVLPPHHIDASDESDAEVPDAWKGSQRPRSGRRSEASITKRRESPRSVTEQVIIDKLTSHASQIADSILSQNDSGQFLEEDIRRAAALWMDTHPPRDISRSQSVQDLPDNFLRISRLHVMTVIQEVMKGQKRKSAGPTVAEYRDKIRGNIITALAKATGLSEADIPTDAELDPALLEQLANQNLAPEDIEIYHDEETGRSYIRSRNRVINEAMGGVEPGHIYQPAGKADGKRVSIPTDRKTHDLGEIGVVNYGGAEKPSSDKAPSEKTPSEVGSKKGSVVGSKKGSIAAGDESLRSGASGEQGDLQKVMADLEQAGSPSRSGEGVSLKSGKSGDKKSQVSEKKKDEFVVGKVQNKKELEELYYRSPEPPEEKKPIEPTKPKTPQSKKSKEPTLVPPKEKEPPKEKAPPKEKKPSTPMKKEKVEAAPAPAAPVKAPKPPPGKPKAGKKPAKAAVGGKKAEGKGAKKKGKGKKKEEEPETAVEAVPPVKEPTPEPLPKEASPKPPSAASEKSESFHQENSDDEEDYIIVRDETMSPEAAPDKGLNLTNSVEEEEPEEEQSEPEVDTEDMSEADKLRMISNREARNAKRAAAADKRRQEVERKRREREEAIKRERDLAERQDKLKAEQEELRRQKEEERRLRAEAEEAERDEVMKEEVERQRREKAELEREKRRKEEYARKLEEMKRKHEDDEKKRQEELERKRLEELERRKEEEEMMARMAEEERLEYERKKREEEEERKRQEELEKKRREEEAARALEEARRLAEEMARKQAELEARLRFNRSLQLESEGLDHTQDITKAFVFSYYELLNWLGLDIPEFELLKLNEY
ncbi:titin homolog isoform X4 [Mya arenaria]|uniref:titin homolog isoform X4 n=1 Tax=Mya arenaria TaxID=6604 RepID=UPI0022DF17D3|nr:titin homolog isoform X4 [Mya arenaria]